MKDKILSHLGAGHIWAGSIRYYPTIESTNTEAKRLAETGAPAGTILIADHQTGGRGRMGRTFHSPKGAGIYLSVILRPDCKATTLMHLTCMVGSAMCDAIEEGIGIRPGIKWINDLVINGKKLGGILTELSVDAGGSVNYAVVGIGINCTQSPNDFPEDIKEIATSLQQLVSQPVDFACVAAKIIRHLYAVSQTVLAPDSNWLARYKADCVTLGQRILVVKNQEKRYGTALDVTSDGSLIVSFEDGTIHTVNSGEVHVRGLYGYC